MPGRDNTDAKKETRRERIKEIRNNEPLTELFQPTNAKILGALIDSPYDLSKTGIAETAGVARSTVYRQIDLLVDLGLVKETRREGDSTMYDISDTRSAELVVELYDSLR